MLTFRYANDRGHFKNDWLDSRHSFSFGDYHDPAHMGVSSLRVINEDRIAAGGGFPTHPHRDMEIVTYVLEGELEHRDSMGNGGIIRSGEVQHMSAGRGITHSEFNPSAEGETHLLQIWLLPNRLRARPVYHQRRFDEGEKRARLRVLVSPDGREDSIPAYSDAVMYATALEAGESRTLVPDRDRQVYVHLARGQAMVAGSPMTPGDAVRAAPGVGVTLEGIRDVEALIFELPG